MLHSKDNAAARRRRRSV